jgi:hypothetical protein
MGKAFAFLYKEHISSHWYICTTVSFPKYLGVTPEIMVKEIEFTLNKFDLLKEVTNLRDEAMSKYKSTIEKYHTTRVNTQIKRYDKFSVDIVQEIVVENEFNINNYCTMINVGDFSVSNYLVTEKLWNDVMGLPKTESMLPKTNVSWYDTQKFLERLNKITGESYHLPTEVQWEYAARGGKLSEGYTYVGSNDIDEVAWHHGNSNNQTQPVGQKKPNELGLFDMSGNVWEWCNDCYDTYPSDSQINPTDPHTSSDRVIRGGSWRDDASRCRVAIRGGDSPGYRGGNLGFRVALG